MTGLQACNFIKMRLQQRCLLVNIAKFLVIAFFIEHLRWLLLLHFGIHLKYCILAHQKTLENLAICFFICVDLFLYLCCLFKVNNRNNRKGKKVWNEFKVNDKNTTTMSVTSLVSSLLFFGHISRIFLVFLFCWLWTCKHFSGNSSHSQVFLAADVPNLPHNIEKFIKKTGDEVLFKQTLLKIRLHHCCFLTLAAIALW